MLVDTHSATGIRVTCYCSVCSDYQPVASLVSKYVSGTSCNFSTEEIMGAQKFQLVLKFSRNGSFSLKCFAIPNKKNSDDFSTLFRELKI